jgi:hypothetical protein
VKPPIRFLALAQHPMSLIIEEDEECAERSPPWGAPTLEAYDARLERFLESIEVRAELVAGFDMSGIELERLAVRRPDLVGRMRTLVRRDRLAFYNGTWSQPHLHLFGAEANIRQFERGGEAIRRIIGCPVRVHAAQEADAHEQLPQLLRAFGFRFAVPPGFYSTLEFQGPHELVHLATQGLRFVHGEEFTEWVGLDGSTIPLYLPQPGPFTPEREARAGFLRVPCIRVSFPDMIEIDDRWLADHRGDRFVLLEEVLQERYAQAPPRSRARLWSDWSYVEGIRAEELGRANRRAESAVLAAESIGTLARILVGRAPDRLDAIWQTILTAQHHDAYCFSAPRLRAKAIDWLATAEHDAAAAADSAACRIAEAIRTEDLPAGTPVVVFNPSPAPTDAVVETGLATPHPTRGIEVRDAGRAQVPAELIAAVEDTSLHRVRFRAQIPGLGYRTYVLRGAEQGSLERAFVEPLRIEDNGFSARVHPDGTFGSLALEPGCRELLAVGKRGNAFSASTPEGDPFTWSADGPAMLVESGLCRLVRVAGSLGPRVHTLTEIRFIRGMRRIDIRLELRFDEESIGDFFNDETKLMVSWPLGFDGAIHHDIPFGAVRTRPGRPFFPVSWVDISDGACGFGYLTRGTQRHLVIGRTLANVIAWGGATDRIGNRAESTPQPWPKAFDQRLRGRHLIEYALFPHEAAWVEAGIVSEARAWSTPLLAKKTGRHDGALPVALNALSVGPATVVPTAVIPAPGGALVRMYEAAGGRTRPLITGERLRLRELAELDGAPIETLAPFRIGLARCDEV